MLTTPEKILFVIFVFIVLALAWSAIRRLIRIIARGDGGPNWRAVPGRALSALARTLTFSPVFRTRPLISLFHGFVGWSFIFYLLVNFGDVLEGFIPDFEFMGQGALGNGYRLGSDFLTVAGLLGVVVLALRRFVLNPEALRVRASTTLHPKAAKGIRRDSAIVIAFILIHLGARWTGESLHLAEAGPDAWQPLASAFAGVWQGLSSATLQVGQHIAWWTALGSILLFVPYFPHSKHIHLFFAPLNFLLSPERRSMGALEALDFEDETIEQFGAERLEDLSWTAFIDAYACIMCNRCQDACPAYQTGKVLSPAALEINKRYFLNQEGSRLAAGEASSQTLLEFAISQEAVWACTACGACNEICPVGNEPMRDILNIRRHLVLMETSFPEQLQAAYRGMERAANPWNVAPDERLKWAEGLDVPTIAKNPEPEILWWVGCAPATDARAQKTARALAQVLQAAGVNFAVLGSEERCTGDSARRSGNEYLFFELASTNVEILNQVAPPRILTTCPHCLHTLRNEYPDFGGHYEVVHHTQFIQELIAAGRLKLEQGAQRDALAFHDPCYLGRQNGEFEAPRQNLNSLGIELTELARSRKNSFCCGAGGAQMWKEEEEGRERVSSNRVREAIESGAGTLAVGCPFCKLMLTDAANEASGELQVRDVVEIVAERLPSPAQGAKSAD